MVNRKTPNIIIEKTSIEKIIDIYEMMVESSKEWFSNGALPKPVYSVDEYEQLIGYLIEGWKNDTFYLFNILDLSHNQYVGFAFINHVNRQYKMANMGYQVRTSRAGEGIATTAAKLVAQYGFEELGFQRLEIVVIKDNIPSQKVAEKLGAIREGLLRNRIQINDVAYDAYMYSLIPSDFGITNTA